MLRKAPTVQSSPSANKVRQIIRKIYNVNENFFGKVRQSTKKDRGLNSGSWGSSNFTDTSESQTLCEFSTHRPSAGKLLDSDLYGHEMAETTSVLKLTDS